MVEVEHQRNGQVHHEHFDQVQQKAGVVLERMMKIQQIIVKIKMKDGEVLEMLPPIARTNGVSGVFFLLTHHNRTVLNDKGISRKIFLKFNFSFAIDKLA